MTRSDPADITVNVFSYKGAVNSEFYLRDYLRLIMKITAKENDVNDIFADSCYRRQRVCN